MLEEELNWIFQLYSSCELELVVYQNTGHPKSLKIVFTKIPL